MEAPSVRPEIERSPVTGDTEADARAKMLAYLIKNGLLEIAA